MLLRRTAASALFLAAASASPALACSCAYQPAESMHQNAAAIFTGVVQATRPAQPGQSITTFTVIETFKGVDKGTQVSIIHPSGSSASCGVKFSRGATYTLSAFDRSGALSANLCTTLRFSQEGGAALIERLRELREER